MPRRLALLLALMAAGCSEDAPPARPPELVQDAAVTTERPEPTGPPLRVRVTGRDFRWHIRYPGPDGVLDTADDRLDQRNLHVPPSTDVELELRSDDFVYSLYLPEYELVEMAFPGRPFIMEFRTGSPGTSRLMGSQMCGFAHEELLGELVVEGLESRE